MGDCLSLAQPINSIVVKFMTLKICRSMSCANYTIESELEGGNIEFACEGGVNQAGYAGFTPRTNLKTRVWRLQVESQDGGLLA
ncbi:MAG TPA: hypothetical protein DCW31_00230 [Lactobacillus sp.]|nr:hypothetical protein [Lactobacillus sp.]